MSKKLQWVIIILLVLNLGLTASTTLVPLFKSSAASSEKAELPKTYNKTLYSWDDTAFSTECRTDFLSCMETLGINTVYQQFSNKQLHSANARSFLADMGELKVEVYRLCGRSQWGTEPNARSMKKAIDEVAIANKVTKNGFKGVIFDVEPYTLDEWDTEEDIVMEKYVANVLEAFKYATKKDIKVIVAIPYWLDKRHEGQLETIIKDGCNGISVMNYGRSSEQANIQKEVELAKKYDKTVDCTFEFQAVGKHQLTDNETYGNVGLEAAKASFEAVYEALAYDKLALGYHYYLPIMELLGSSETD